MNNSCESCPKYHVNENNFEEDIKSSTDTDKSDSSNNENHSIKYYTWMMITRKSSKVTASLPFSDVLETVMEKIVRICEEKMLWFSLSYAESWSRKLGSGVYSCIK